MSEKKSKFNLKEILGILALLFSGAFFIYVFRFTGGADIWYDEVFSLMFARGSFSEIVASTARDVHPPLYYLYLKAFTALGTFILGKESFYMAAKTASLFPWLVLFIVDITYIRKRFGLFTAGFFALLISLMPQIPVYYLEIRMYSLALLFVTLQVLVAERIISSQEKTTAPVWILFFLFGIATAYTQYYACIATIGIYLSTFGVLFADRENPDKKKLAWVLLSAILSCILYLPWIPVLMKQIAGISGNYWIQPLTLRSIAGCVKFVILPEGAYGGRLSYIAAGLVILAITVAFFKSFSNILKLTVLMLAPAVFVVLSGFVLSALGTPIFIYRYLIPTMGAFWLFTSIILDRALSRRLGALLLIPFLMVGVMNFKGFCAEEQKKLDQAPAAFEAVSEIPENAAIITNFDHVTAVMAYYRPDCKVYLYEMPIDKLLSDGLGNITDLFHDNQVKELVESGIPVYFLGSFNSREEIVQNWQGQGMSSDLLGEALIERYWINIYRLK